MLHIDRNEIIKTIGEYIPTKILEGVQRACIFSVLENEVSDISNEEQLNLVVRFVNEFNQVKVCSV